MSGIKNSQFSRVTEKYGIAGPVPFVDVYLQRDNPLYLDPSAIRNGRDDRSRRAHALIVDYFARVIRLQRSELSADRDASRELLLHLHEPNETRLGSTKNGVAGKAISDGIADWLWDALATNRAAQSGALNRLERLRLFVHKVGYDLTSDLATRVLYGILAEFTQEMMQRHPSLATDQVAVDVDIYSNVQGQWVSSQVALPLAESGTRGERAPLLLIPKEWVYWRLLMDAEPFYNRYATATVQEERGTYDSKGRLRGPSKETLKEEFQDHRQLNTDQVVRYAESDNENERRDLTAEYQEYVDRGFEPLTDDQITDRIS